MTLQIYHLCRRQEKSYVRSRGKVIKVYLPTGQQVVSACKELNPCQIILEEPSVREGYDTHILKSCVNTKVSVQPSYSGSKSDRNIFFGLLITQTISRTRDCRPLLRTGSVKRNNTQLINSRSMHWFKLITQGHLYVWIHLYLYWEVLTVLKLFSLNRVIAYWSLQHTWLYPLTPCSKEEGNFCIRVLTRLVSLLKKNGKE